MEKKATWKGTVYNIDYLTLCSRTCEVHPWLLFESFGEVLLLCEGSVWVALVIIAHFAHAFIEGVEHVRPPHCGDVVTAQAILVLVYLAEFGGAIAYAQNIGANAVPLGQPLAMCLQGIRTTRAALVCKLDHLISS